VISGGRALHDFNLQPDTLHIESPSRPSGAQGLSKVQGAIVRCRGGRVVQAEPGN
jgi:hypothetical protein